MGRVLELDQIIGNHRLLDKITLAAYRTKHQKWKEARKKAILSPNSRK